MFSLTLLDDGLNDDIPLIYCFPKLLLFILLLLLAELVFEFVVLLVKLLLLLFVIEFVLETTFPFLLVVEFGTFLKLFVLCNVLNLEFVL